MNDTIKMQAAVDSPRGEPASNSTVYLLLLHLQYMMRRREDEFDRQVNRRLLPGYLGQDIMRK